MLPDSRAHLVILLVSYRIFALTLTTVNKIELNAHSQEARITCNLATDLRETILHSPWLTLQVEVVRCSGQT
jgi:hypothetical protein